ncbi:FecR domain-containing protein [soil metagenome]
MRLGLDPDPAETAAIYRWIDADPAHAVAFARAEVAWEASARLKASPTERAALANAPESPAYAHPPKRRRIMAAAMIAATLLAAISLVTFHKLYGMQRYATAIGQVSDVHLADGSVMHLNSGSVAEVRLTDHGRFIHVLNGEISFDVAHDKTRPFDVQAQSAVIRAVGTAFNVRLRESLVELTVTQGIVAVRSGKGVGQRVNAGNGAAIRPETIALTRLGPQLIGQRMAWREHMVELDGDTVEQAIAEFNRYRKAPLVIGDARVSGLRIGGRFRTTESEQFLAALQLTLPIRAVPGEDGSVMLLHKEE